MKKNIVIAILLIITVLLGGTLYYQYTNQNKIYEKCKEEKKEKASEALDVTSKEVTELFNGVNDLAKNRLSDAYFGYLYKQDELKVEDMSDELVVANAVYKEYLGCGEKCVRKSINEQEIDNFVISGDKVKENVNNLFGNIEYKNVNLKQFDCQGAFNYNQQENNYINDFYGCGYGLQDSKNLLTFITKAVKENSEGEKEEDFIDIYVKIAFEYIKVDEEKPEQESIRSIYTDYNMVNKIYEAKEMEYNEETLLKNVREKLPTYKLHFEKENNTYHFKQINIIK